VVRWDKSIPRNTVDQIRVVCHTVYYIDDFALFSYDRLDLSVDHVLLEMYNNPDFYVVIRSLTNADYALVKGRRVVASRSMIAHVLAIGEGALTGRNVRYYMKKLGLKFSTTTL
jgi:hypothetical protein